MPASPEKQGKPLAGDGARAAAVKAIIKHVSLYAGATWFSNCGMTMIFAKARLAVRAGLLLAGCGVLSACGAGAGDDVYAMPLTEAKAKISGTQASYQSGSQTRSMHSAGLSPEGLRVSLSNAGTYSSSCIIRFEQVSADTTRVTPDCGDTGAAVTDAGAQFFEMEIAAFVRQILTGEPVDADALARQMVALTMKSLPKMQQEGFAADEKWVEAQQEAAIQRVEDQKAGWAE